jgi:hypothetical protein
VLAPLEGQLLLRLARGALEPEDDLLRSLGLLVKDGLRLTTVTGLLAIVPALTLREGRGLAGLVLGDLVQLVLAALLAGAERLPGLGNVHHFRGCLPALSVLVGVVERVR